MATFAKLATLGKNIVVADDGRRTCRQGAVHSEYFHIAQNRIKCRANNYDNPDSGATGLFTVDQ